jgi:hypothetical protein
MNQLECTVKACHWNGLLHSCGGGGMLVRWSLYFVHSLVYLCLCSYEHFCLVWHNHHYSVAVRTNFCSEFLVAVLSLNVLDTYSSLSFTPFFPWLWNVYMVLRKHFQHCPYLGKFMKINFLFLLSLKIPFLYLIFVRNLPKTKQKLVELYYFQSCVVVHVDGVRLYLWTIGLDFIPRWHMSMEHLWNDIDGGIRRHWRKTISVQLCPPHISHGMTWARTQAAAVRGRPLASWALRGVFQFFGSLFYDAFSVTRPYSVDGRVTSQWWQRIDEDRHPCLSGIRTHGLSVQAIKGHASDRAPTETGSVSLWWRALFYCCVMLRRDEASSLLSLCSWITHDLKYSAS